MNEIICGDALATLKTLESGIVQTCITSPPYFGLRDYGTETILTLEGDPECTHEWIHEGRWEDGAKVAQCKHCDAGKVDYQIGLELEPETYINRLVEVFREVRRVLRDDGTLWVNIGDSYSSDTKGSGGGGTSSGLRRDGRPEESRIKSAQISLSHQRFNAHRINTGLKPKDLIGIPWMLAFALRADGWYLRSDIIWHKPNCMPESVTDRPTKAHEYIFLLSKNERYFYDSEAIKEGDHVYTRKGTRQGHHLTQMEGYKGIAGGTLKRDPDEAYGFARDITTIGRNKRSVWTVATSPYSEAHFATFPPKLIEPCVLAGTSPQACEHCGAPWERVTEKGEAFKAQNGAVETVKKIHDAQGKHGATSAFNTGYYHARNTLGWQPTCTCTNEGSGSCVVLDCFCGAGTVPLVALKYQRAYIGIELNPEYVEMANKRIHTVQPVLWEVSA